MVNDEDRLVSAIVALRAAFAEGRTPIIEVMTLLQVLFEIIARVLAVQFLPAMASEPRAVLLTELLDALPCGDASDEGRSLESHQATERLRSEVFGMLEDAGETDLLEKLAERQKDLPFLRAVLPILLEFARLFVMA